MKTLTLLTTTLLITGCSYLETPRVKEITAANKEGCVYITNVAELLATFTSHTEKAKYGGNIGYSGIELGGTIDEKRKFYRLQAELGQEAATINSTIKAIVLLSNKSCSKENLEKAWNTMDKLIDAVAKVYAPVLMK